MKLLMTTNEGLTTCTLYDTELKTIKHIPFEKGQENTNCDTTRPTHRPFGITWDASNIYIANRKSLLVYDNNFNWIDKLEILDENTHQIAFINGRIVACMTRKDSIALIDPHTSERIMFHPDHGWAEDFPTLTHPGMEYKPGMERYHINSVTPFEGKLYFLINRPAHIVELNMNSKQIDDLIPVSETMVHSLCHNLLIAKNIKKTIKANGAILEIGENGRNRDLYVRNKNMYNYLFFRGAAGILSDPLYAYSQNTFNQLENNPSGLTNGDNFNFNKICDIRRVCGQDDAHHNPHPFPYLWQQ